MTTENNEDKHFFEIRIDEQSFNLSNPEPTGKELLALVGKSPDRFLLTLVIPNQPDQLVDPDETVDISGVGTEQFALISKERHYAFRIDEHPFTITNPSPTGRELLALVSKTPETHQLTISLANQDDEFIDADEKVNLEQPGREQFFVVVRNPLTIIIDETPYTPNKTQMTGVELRHLPKPPVSDARDLWLDVPGKDDHRIKPADTIHLKDGMVFYTAPSTINPGACS